MATASGPGDDTKVHRSSAGVWGTCTFHEYTARCPKRATTVRAHHGVCLGALLPQENQPALDAAVAGAWYFRASQLPGPGSHGEPAPAFRTKNALVVAFMRQQAQEIPGPHVLVVEGGFAKRTVLRPLACPEAGPPRVDVLTRLRHDAHLCALPSAAAQAEARPGPKRRWGRRLAPPRQGGRWPGPWHEGQAFLYGRWRQSRWKEVLGLWHPLGAELPVKVVVAEVEG